MKRTLDQRGLGQRISQLRKHKGLSQEDLSHIVEVSRSSLAQIELGKRAIDVFEFQRLGNALGFSLDDMMSSTYELLDDQIVSEPNPTLLKKERTPIPRIQTNKLKNVLLYILEKCGGKSNVGESNIHTLLYFIDFNFYEIFEEHLTGTRYKKLPFGPIPHQIESIIQNMIESKQIKRFKSEYRSTTQLRLIPLVKPDLSLLKANEKEVIDHVVLQMGDWTSQMISDYAQNDLPYQTTDNCDFISYELAFYRELPYSVRIYQEED